jgi:hypothetical protein
MGKLKDTTVALALALACVTAFAQGCGGTTCTGTGCAPNDAGSCGPANCSGCCDSSGKCQTPGVGPQATRECGIFGATCVVCPAADVCNAAGHCQDAACLGCSDATGSCRSGAETAACGSGGALCVACAVGYTCSSFECVSAVRPDAGTGDGGTSSCDAVGATCTSDASGNNNCCSGYCKSGVCVCNGTGSCKYQCASSADCCSGLSCATGMAAQNCYNAAGCAAFGCCQ